MEVSPQEGIADMQPIQTSDNISVEAKIKLKFENKQCRYQVYSLVYLANKHCLAMLNKPAPYTMFHRE